MRTRIFVLISALCLSGCSLFGTYNPATGRNEFIFIPTSDEVKMGQDIHAKLVREYRLSDNLVQTQRVQRIGQALARQSERQDYAYHFFLIQKDEMNAFTVPGGRIYVFTGLLDKLNSDEEIAAVIGHEIGHCSARHTIKKFQAAVGYNLIGGLILSQLGAEEQVLKIAQMSSNTVMQLVFSAYGRQDEYEADRLGLRYMQRAGYDLNGMLRTLEVLQKNSSGGGAPLMLRTHPYLTDRIVAVRQEIKRMK